MDMVKKLTLGLHLTKQVYACRTFDIIYDII